MDPSAMEIALLFYGFFQSLDQSTFISEGNQRRFCYLKVLFKIKIK